ncbi:MAG: hypothetical protein FWG77_04890 [Treponema sp.]|nr:hypothetical protein [Treponema sp.]
MAKEKKQQILAWPPGNYHWLENMSDLERLSVIYSKLEAITTFFSYYEAPSSNKPVAASDVYGYWHIIKDICNELSDILKIDHWTGEIGKKGGEQ